MVIRPLVVSTVESAEKHFTLILPRCLPLFPFPPLDDPSPDDFDSPLFDPFVEELLDEEELDELDELLLEELVELLEEVLEVLEVEDVLLPDEEVIESPVFAALELMSLSIVVESDDQVWWVPDEP